MGGAEINVNETRKRKETKLRKKKTRGGELRLLLLSYHQVRYGLGLRGLGLRGGVWEIVPLRVGKGSQPFQ